MENRENPFIKIGGPEGLVFPVPVKVENGPGFQVSIIKMFVTFYLLIFYISLTLSHLQP